MKLIDITGQRFGRLLVVSISGASGNKRFWNCKCDCGTEKAISGNGLKAGDSKSCGCLNRELVVSRPTTHGMSKTRIFGIWKGMHTRCYNPNYAGYKNYGGRGVTICDDWHKFEAFYADMGSSYAAGLTIERIDNDVGYQPGNCRWIPKPEQSRNRVGGESWDFKSAPIAGNTSGIRGVSWSKRDSRWTASIMINGRQKNLRRFDTIEEAAAAYKAAASRRTPRCASHSLAATT